MLPRKKLDIGWSDLFVAAMRCCWPGHAEVVQQHLQRDWANGSSLACLSVRTGFDLVLTTLDLPRGSEVILSAINIRDMVRIVQAHGLVPIPVDVDMETLSVDAANIERLVTPRTRVVVIAHLFGSRMPLDAIIEIGDRLGLLIVEDCAQAYVGNGEGGHPAAHVRMFSFGPIKTSTALGGAMLGFRDPALATAVRALEAKLPRQTRRMFIARVLKYTMLKALLLRPMFTLFVAACRASGRSHDDVINGAVRGFAGPDFIKRIRRRASYPLLALLRRRLTGFKHSSITARIASADFAISLLPDVRRPGRRAVVHSHWVFPIQTPEPDVLMARLWKAGFDATRGASSLHVIEPPPGRPDSAPRTAAMAMCEVLYLPVYPGVPARALRRMASEIAAISARRPPANVEIEQSDFAQPRRQVLD